MSENEESLIAQAITKDSRGDRIFAYILLSVFSVVGTIMGYVMWGLVTSLSSNMQSMASDMHSMRNEISSMSTHIKSMDTSMSTMTTDISKMSKSMESMQSDIHDMNKMNPARLF